MTSQHVTTMRFYEAITDAVEIMREERPAGLRLLLTDGKLAFQVGDVNLEPITLTDPNGATGPDAAWQIHPFDAVALRVELWQGITAASAYSTDLSGMSATLTRQPDMLLIEGDYIGRRELPARHLDVDEVELHQYSVAGCYDEQANEFHVAAVFAGPAPALDSDPNDGFQRMVHDVEACDPDEAEALARALALDEDTEDDDEL